MATFVYAGATKAKWLCLASTLLFFIILFVVPSCCALSSSSSSVNALSESTRKELNKAVKSAYKVASKDVTKELFRRLRKYRIYCEDDFMQKKTVDMLKLLGITLFDKKVKAALKQRGATEGAEERINKLKELFKKQGESMDDEVRHFAVLAAYYEKYLGLLSSSECLPTRQLNLLKALLCKVLLSHSDDGVKQICRSHLKSIESAEELDNTLAQLLIVLLRIKEKKQELPRPEDFEYESIDLFLKGLCKNKSKLQNMKEAMTKARPKSCCLL